MTYGLYNKKLDRRLTHPVVGMWFTKEYKEAEDMLVACYEYLESSGLGHMKDDFAIINVESGDVVEKEAVAAR